MVVHNSINLIKNAMPPRLTRFESSRIIGARALQISFGAPVLIPIPYHILDSIDMAVLELKEKALPMIVRRRLPDGSYKDIPLIDLQQTRILQ